MKLEDIKQYFNDNKDNDEVKAYLGELSAVSTDKVKGFLNTDEGKRLIQPDLDRYHNKSLESWKANNLDSLVEAELQKRNPSKSPEQLELEKLRKEIEDERKARNREVLVNKALKVAKEKNLPDGIIDYFIAENEEGTIENLSKLEEVFSQSVQSAVDSKFKENGRDIDFSNPTNKTGKIDVDSLASQVSLRQ
ncbi:DUF4355 domain-containing protein [Bacillus sp. MCCB 382]|uniref:DUF4355 domain-containing protein n=1 Tax=Bacillus sp. MCCB 382 TaxID=2860197 RepID=UPI001C571BA4|nr:DUF4355 domain-containing protein [Bacillus sp. MCCB 382]